MRIGIDISSAVGRAAGIGFYTKSLVQGLSEIDSKNTYFLYTPEQVNWNLSENFRQIVIPKSSFVERLIWFFRLFWDTQVVGKVNVFLSPNSLPIAVLSLPRRNVLLSVMDIVPYKMRHTAEFKVRIMFAMLPLALKFCKSILAISHATKRDLIEHLGVPDKKITVTHLASHGDNVINVSSKDVDRVKKKYGLSAEYFLFISTLEPRKNIPGLIQGFSRFKNTNKNEIKLVIGGKKGWLYDEIFSIVKDLEMQDEVIFTNYIPDEDLLPLYKGALAFTCVPFMEGFGLSPLTAMECGLPVLTSNTSSLPEVVGDAAITVDPNDIDAIAEGMRKLACDSRLREEMIQKGFEQAKNFSWEKTARVTLKILEKLDKAS